MKEKDSLLASLYDKEKELLIQLEAIQSTIKAFGGTTKKVESVKLKSEKVPTIVVGPIKPEKTEKSEKIEEPKKEARTRNSI